MARIAGETRLTQPVHEMVDATDHNKTGHTLGEFWKSTIALRHVLDQGRSLSDQELRLLENHFHALQMTYLRWKRR